MVSIDEKTLEFLKANPEKSYFDNEFTKYQFSNDKLLITPLNKLNTLSQLKQIQRDLTRRNLELEHSWQLLLLDYNINKSSNVDERETLLDPLSSFRYAVGLGYYPHPEVLIALFDCFETYLSLDGKVELEKIFFGEKKQGIGNHSARKARENIMKHFHYRWSQLASKKTTDSKTQPELAEEIIEKLKLEDDVDSFLRKYRRYIAKITEK
jgi:hypothetical protein